MTDQATPSPLELAIQTADQSDVESLRKVLLTLATAQVTVLMDKPWNGVSPPQDGTRMMLVSDGSNQQQPMLALFTHAAVAEKFLSADNPFLYPVAVDARFAIVGLATNAGIIINPNSTPTFRIDPSLAKTLQDNALEQLRHLKQTANNQK
ncbi:MAG: SseB family protein [Gammaproteobacteria bacterium]